MSLTPLQRADQIRDVLLDLLAPPAPLDPDVYVAELLPPGAIVLTADEANEIARAIRQAGLLEPLREPALALLEGDQ